MLIKICFLMLVASIVIGCSDRNKIGSPPKIIKKSKNALSVEGRWKALPGTKPDIISKINFTSITCERKRMTCKEIESLVFTPEEQPNLNKNLLYNQEWMYKIIAFSKDIIKAKSSGFGMDMEITISLRDNVVQKDFRESKARSSKGDDPYNYGRWVLE